MKNIYSILKQVGIEVPAEKKDEFDSLLNENYKTIEEVKGIKSNLEKITSERDALQTRYDDDVKQRDEDLKKLQEQLKNAGTDSEKLKTTLDELTALKSTYEADKTKYEEQLSKQRYEFAVKEKVNGLKFTSNGAKRSFMNDILAKELKMEGDNLLGFDDFVNAYKEQDAGVFVVEDNNNNGDGDNKPAPKFSSKVDNKNSGEKNDAPKKDRPLIW